MVMGGLRSVDQRFVVARGEEESALGGILELLEQDIG